MKRSDARCGLILTMLLAAFPALAETVTPETSLTQKVDAAAVLLERLAKNQRLLKALTEGTTTKPEGIRLVLLGGFRLELSPLQYQISGGTLVQNPEALVSQEAYNCSTLEQSSSVEFQASKGSSLTHEFSYGFTEGVSASFSGGVPGGAEASVSASVEFTQNVTNSTTTTKEDSWTATAPLRLSPGKKMVAQLVVTDIVYDKVPFTTKAVARGKASLMYKIGGPLPGTRTIDLDQYLSESERSFLLKGTLKGNMTGKTAAVKWGAEEPADCGGSASASVVAGQRAAPSGKLSGIGVRKLPANQVIKVALVKGSIPVVGRTR